MCLDGIFQGSGLNAADFRLSRSLERSERPRLNPINAMSVGRASHVAYTWIDHRRFRYERVPYKEVITYA